MQPATDIDSLRTEHESDEQWTVRRNFMVEHKDDFGEDELITLAQLFHVRLVVTPCCHTSVTISKLFSSWLHCLVDHKYPPETMKRIAKLSEQVASKYRDSRKNKLKRTFVQASSAAEQKAKRTFK